jgi:hypothetical protein
MSQPTSSSGQPRASTDSSAPLLKPQQSAAEKKAAEKAAKKAEAAKLGVKPGHPVVGGGFQMGM